MTTDEQIRVLKSTLLELERVTKDHSMFNRAIFDAIVERDDYDLASKIGGDEATFSVLAAICRIALNECEK